jgi:hypothetical protein
MRAADQIATWILGAVLLTFAMRSHAQAQSDEDLANKLSNPVASLISVPFQYNYDHEFGADRDGHKSYLNIQPVIPTKLSSDWNLISRVSARATTRTVRAAVPAAGALAQWSRCFFPNERPRDRTMDSSDSRRIP